MSRIQEQLSRMPESVQRMYYLDHPTLLSPYETPWTELARRGYVGGGIVLFVINPKGELLMNQVPPYREKPVIGRYAGQWNVFTETIERYPGGQHAGQFEDFIDNLARTIDEEIGAAAARQIKIFPDGMRETDYRDPRAHQKIRVHCVVVGSPTEAIRDIDAHDAQANIPRELNILAWKRLDNLNKLHVEPNAKRMTDRMKRSGYLQMMIDRIVSGEPGTPLLRYISEHVHTF
ncbi:MAG: hypothetical protein NT149_00090 [Candidatus Gottesmanbacteria bacterium]|nr:hypothetical protein [Candidatus Gottesmanbacteria bacterium]